MNDEEIVEDVLQEREEFESENEDEVSSNAVTPSQACAAFDTALEWLESKLKSFHIFNKLIHVFTGVFVNFK